MKFSEIVKQAIALLQDKGQVSYRMLKREFALDEDTLADLTAELVEVDRIAVDQDGKMLVWVGEKRPESRVQSPKSKTSGLPDSGLRSSDPGHWTPPHLADRIRAATVTDGERKTITALFADLKGSTALIEGLDPEEARAIIDPALQLMMDAVHRYEGYVAQALGDGIFALFGAPIAHEDHPQRALYAALRMQEEMRRYSDQIRLKHGVPLAMRVGINTGEVVVRSIRKDDLHADYVPVGHSTNLAARMEQMATPGSILVTAHTHKLTEGYFEFKNLGQTQIKGVEEPLQVYEVLGAGPLRTRLQVSAQRGLTRFVGRQTEMEQMRNALEQIKTGRGQIVGVMGEPGLGKSRVFYEFKLLSQSGCLILEAYSVSHGKASPYLPVIELLKSYFRVESQDDERTRREKVGGKVLMLDRSLEDTLPYLFALLGIEEQLTPLQQMDPQIRRTRTFEALKKLFLRESLKQPLILVFEDLHWIDSETQGFLDTLSEGIASAKILLLVNYRPEYRHEWGQKTYYTQLWLAPFGRAEAEEFLASLLGNEEHLNTVKHLILDKTEGTPLFIEEVLQTLVENGTLAGERGHYALTQPVTTLQLPTTVQGVLAARIDRLAPEEKTLLQQLAVIGREFSLGLIRQVISQREDDLYRLLSALQRKEFLYEQPAFPEVEYLFKHALTQEVAYNSVLIERRKVLHQQTAHAIEQLYHDRLEEHYSELAHHYSRSGNSEKAAVYHRKAGEQAVQRSASMEAIGHFTSALEFLQLLPANSERLRQELAIYIALGVLFMATKGFAADEVQGAYTRAHALCLQLQDTIQLFRVLGGLWNYYALKGELQKSQEIAEQIMTLVADRQEAPVHIEAQRALAVTCLAMGEVTKAKELLDQALTRLSEYPQGITPLLNGLEPTMGCLVQQARCLWLLGYPDQANHNIREGLSRVQDRKQPFSEAFALSMATGVAQYQGDVESVHQRASTLATIVQEYGLATFFAWSACVGGWAQVRRERSGAGITQIEEGLAYYRSIGTENGQAYFLALLADAYLYIEHANEGLTVVDDALRKAEQVAERFWEAELYRLKGELTLQQESREQRAGSLEQEADACFLKAIAVAQKQQAKSLELRATMSLARLWQQQGKCPEAHQMLSAIYNWFTEGFDTKDLQEAKALLESLEARG